MENFSSLKRFLSTRSLLQVPSRSKLDAVESFTARTLSAIPATWIKDLLLFRGRPSAMPMYGYLFAIDERWLESAIEDKLESFDFGEDAERQQLIDDGWMVIPSTGLFAYPLDGRILIGIDGVGYDFFEAHWEPLYDLLSLKWHE